MTLVDAFYEKCLYLADGDAPMFDTSREATSQYTEDIKN
jgi:hypothetical protein